MQQAADGADLLRKRAQRLAPAQVEALKVVKPHERCGQAQERLAPAEAQHAQGAQGHAPEEQAAVEGFERLGERLAVSPQVVVREIEGADLAHTHLAQAAREGAHVPVVPAAVAQVQILQPAEAVLHDLAVQPRDGRAVGAVGEGLLAEDGGKGRRRERRRLGARRADHLQRLLLDPL